MVKWLRVEKGFTSLKLVRSLLPFEHNKFLSLFDDAL